MTACLTLLLKSIMFFHLIDNTSPLKNNEQNLYDHLFQNYNKEIMPSYASKPVVIDLELYLYELVEINEINQIFSVNIWLRYMWIDQRLQWPIKSQNQTFPATFRISPSKIWIPDLSLYNSASKTHLLFDEKSGPHVQARLYHSGLVRWIPPLPVKASCAMKLGSFPFDVQICTLELGSWAYDTSRIDINLSGQNFQHPKAINFSTSSSPAQYLKIGQTNLNNYNPNTAWDLHFSPAVKQIYDFADLARFDYVSLADHTANITYTKFVEESTLHIHEYEQNISTFAVLKFHFLFSRNNNKIRSNIILPCLTFGLMCCVSCIVPPNSGERLGVSLSILISISVYQIVVSDLIPKATDEFPVISIFLVTLVLMVCISTVTTILILRIEFTPIVNRPIKIVKLFFINKYLSYLIFEHGVLFDKIKRLDSVIQGEANALTITDIQFPELDLEEDWQMPKIYKAASITSINRHMSIRRRTAKTDTELDQKSHLKFRKKKAILEKKQAEFEWKYLSLLFDRICLLVYFIISISVTFWMYSFNQVEQQVDNLLRENNLIS